MSEPRRPIFSPVLIALLGGMLLANLGHNMYYPFLGLFLKSLGFPVQAIGLYFTAAAVFPLIFHILGGWISDRIGRVRSIAVGSLAGTLAWVGVVLAPSMAAPIAWLLASEAFAAVTQALVGPSFDAFTAEQSSHASRARVFAVVQTVFTVVLIVGPPLGGFIVERFSFRALLFTSACLYWSATVIRVALARRVGQPPGRTRSAQDRQSGQSDRRVVGTGLRASLLRMGALALAGGLFTWILIVDGALDFATRICESLLPLYLKEVGRLAESRIGLLQGLSAVCTALAMIPMGTLADRKGERYPVALGCILMAGAAALLAFGHGVGAYAIGFAVLGLSGGCFTPALQSIISKAVPQRLRGMAYGFLSTSLGVFSFFAPAVGGALWKAAFPALPLLLAGAIALLAAVPALLALRAPHAV